MIVDVWNRCFLNIPCAYKQLLGIECPFCGGQRAVELLLQGRFADSVRMFPALLPLAATPLFIGHRRALRVMLLLDLALVLGNWLWRMF